MFLAQLPSVVQGDNKHQCDKITHPKINVFCVCALDSYLPVMRMLTYLGLYKTYLLSVHTQQVFLTSFYSF